MILEPGSGIMFKIVLLELIQGHFKYTTLKEVKGYREAISACKAIALERFGAECEFRRNQSLFGGYYANRVTGDTIELR
jgi:hypothetical protein